MGWYSFSAVLVTRWDRELLSGLVPCSPVPRVFGPANRARQ